ncbi:MAG: dienelactone hydrolase family protein [Acidobacteriota bacterium]|jgi:carboxymethylenebutenolidase
MSEWVQLKAADGHELSAYLAKPEGAAKAALVVVQEIFGVNAHIRGVADSFAREGYLAIAPALFDRFERGVELRYEGADMQRAFGFYQQLKPETTLLDVASAFQHVQGGHKTGVIGYCYGGLTAWMSATRGPAAGMRPDCAVGYYPGGIGGVASEKPSCPVLLHFGEKDTHIGSEQIDAVRKQNYPDVTIFVYPEAEHGFNCDARGSFSPAAAQLARERTLQFLGKHLLG